MRLISILVAACIFSVAHAEQDEEKNTDPWMGLNQVSYGINNVADTIILKPLATGYQTVTPVPLRRGVKNFFGNLGDVNNSVNNLLQGKLLASGGDLLRLVINSSMGIGGLFDVASAMGLNKHNESFGQTLSVWGVPAGPYVVIPLLGPSTLTDAITNPLNTALDPIRFLHPVSHRNSLFGFRAIEQRATLLAAESAVFGDRYIFLRDAYLQRRNYLVLDGNVEEEEF